MPTELPIQDYQSEQAKPAEIDGSLKFNPRPYSSDEDPLVRENDPNPDQEHPSLLDGLDGKLDEFQRRNPDFMDRTLSILNPRNPNNKDSGKVVLGLTAVALAAMSSFIPGKANAGQRKPSIKQPTVSTVVAKSNEIPLDLKEPSNETITISNPVNSAKKIEQQTPTNGSITTEQLEWISPQVNKQVKENLTVMIPIYKEVQEVTGLNWKLLASVHYRENNNDPHYSVHAGELLGTTNVDFGDIKPIEIEENAISAAKVYIQNAKNYYGIDATKPMTDEEIKLSLLSYNRGHKYADQGASPELSAYVMNLYHSPEFMKWSNDVRLENHSKRGEVDKKIGAYPFWLYLKDAEDNNIRQ